MTLDLLSIENLKDRLSENELTYLVSAIPKSHRIGVGNFVLSQRKLFNTHAADLAAVFMAIEEAPSDLNLQNFEFSFIEWLRENGVSSARITQLKGAIRIKRRAKAEDSFYDKCQRQVIQELEVEKAYLFGRLTWEGQSKAFATHQSQGQITLKDLRELVKDYQYDFKSHWKRRDDWKPGNESSTSHSSQSTSNVSRPASTLAYDLALTLQSVVDQMLDIQPQWQSDHRIIELIDVRRLSDLAEQLFPGHVIGPEF
jgi:hypothetical protein